MMEETVWVCWVEIAETTEKVIQALRFKAGWNGTSRKAVPKAGRQKGRVERAEGGKLV